MKKFILLFFLSHAITFSICAANLSLCSPDGKVRAIIRVGKEINIQMDYDGVTYLQIPHHTLLLDNTEIGKDVKIKKIRKRYVDNIISPLYSINNQIHEKYHELQIDCRGNYSVIFRAYNEGLAWRFVTSMGKSIKVKEEKIDFHFQDNYKVYFHPFLSESDYRIQAVSDHHLPRNYSSMPVLVKPDDKVNILIHESDVLGYPCMSLMSSEERPNTLTSIHPKYPRTAEPGGHMNFNLVVKDTEEYIARTSGNHTFPWRITAFTNSDKAILSNQLVYLLASENKLMDTGWIKPGKVAWDWWHGLNLTGVDFRTGLNTETYKYYIDFAARHGIEYVNLDEGWSDQFNLLQVSKDIDMEELASYARSKGIGLFLWCVWHTIDKQMKEALDQFEKWGIAGIKVDFMDRDDQIVVEFQERLLREAAKHKILVNFHGAYHPNGMERTYPNCINVEGVKGLEANKMAGGGATPTGAVSIPFIRMFAGPMDYTPGAMNNYNQEEWRMIKKRPMSQGTRCQQLAMYVVYYGPLQMLADSPASYEKEPRFLKFLASIPTTWDKTVPLDSKVGEYVNIARCKDRTWFVAGMTDWTRRKQHVTFDFLDEDEDYIAEIVSDGMNADRVGSDYTIIMKNVRNGDYIDLEMMPGGGYTMKLTPKTLKTDIVVFGDSRVQLGGDWGKKLGRKEVVNAGFGGFTTSHFIWLIKSNVIDRHPRICLLEGGINDIGAGIPLERTKRNYQSLVDSLLAHGIEVIMQAVTYPTEKDINVQNFKVSMIDSLNAFIHDFAKSKGLPCINLNPRLTEGKRLKKEYAIDNVHFTPAAYIIWAEEINNILEKKEL